MYYICYLFYEFMYYDYVKVLQLSTTVHYATGKLD